MGNLEPAATGTTNNSYATILRSSAVMGASFAIVMVFSFVRMKFMAVWLGPSGVGLLGVLSTILDLCVALAGLGVQQSGVRQVAAAQSDVARDDVASAIRWLSLGLGVVGATILLITALPISHLTFGSDHYVSAVAILGLAVLLRILGGGQLALLQGLRQISILARANILSAFASTALCVPMVYFWKEQAVAPVVVVMAGVTAIVTWRLGQRFVPSSRAAWPQVATESKALVHLGLVFMASTLLTTGSAYLARLVILQNAGIVGAGLYQAAWALGVLYSGFILQAMGSDFFPRLSRIANDDAASNRLVNEQIRVSILLAAPGVLGTITFAQLVMHLFYAAQFEAAADTLRWIGFGTYLQTLAWPAGFILLAKGAKRPFFWLEVSTAVVQVTLMVLLVPIYGHVGAGMAFCLMYLSHTAAVTYLAKRASGFAWSRDNALIALGYLSVIAAVFAGFYLLEALQALALGVTATVLAGCFSAAALLQLVPVAALPPIMRPLASRLR